MFLAASFILFVTITKINTNVQGLTTENFSKNLNIVDHDEKQLMLIDISKSSL